MGINLNPMRMTLFNTKIKTHKTVYTLIQVLKQMLYEMISCF